jgi:hypothetical protein
MTPRQQRRLEQKLARKAAKKHVQPELEQTLSPARDSLAPQHQPISEARLLANRANSQLSTGPTSSTGKQIVSHNAIKHGLTGKFKVLPSESQSDFDQLLAAFLHSEAPVEEDEVEMVHQMTEALWLSRRCVRLQNDCFAALESGERLAAHKQLALYMRYQTTHDRAFSRYAAELRKRRSERARAERGFVSQKHKAAAEARRQEGEIRKQELHGLRVQLQTSRQERVLINNRIAAAKAERLELQNLGLKNVAEPENKVLAAAVN